MLFPQKLGERYPKFGCIVRKIPLIYLHHDFKRSRGFLFIGTEGSPTAENSLYHVFRTYFFQRTAASYGIPYSKGRKARIYAFKTLFGAARFRQVV